MLSIPSLLLGAASVAAAGPIPQPPMVVTASRIEQEIGDTLAGVTLITRAEIEASQATSIVGLLRLQAGVEFSRTGGPGHQTSLFLRGTNSNHVLVLINGVQVNSLQTGAFSWQHLMLSQIQRIEILRGPAAAFYGSEAIGGVIQIFTRRPNGATAHFEAGSYGTYAVSAAIGGGKDVRYHLTASHRTSEGFSAQNKHGFSFDPDDDGYDNTSLSAGFSMPLADGRLSADLWRSEGEVEFDQGYTETVNQTASVQATLGAHRFRVEYAHSQLETPAFFSGFKSERMSAEWQYHQTLENFAWSAGLDYTHEEGASYSLATGAARYRGNRDNFGLYGAVRIPFDAFTFRAALRHDRNSEFGGHTTGEAALAWQVTDRTRIWTSVGTAFRGPTLNELFSPGFGGLFAGNPNLEPETSKSYELALEHQFATNQTLTVNLYATRIDNLIAFQGEDFRAININEASVNGLEARYDWTSANWRFGGALTLQDTENESSGEDLLRRADKKLAVTLDYLLPSGGNVGVEVIYHGERLDIGNTTLDPFTLVNLRLRWPLNDTWILTGRVDNVLDADYALVHGYNTAGRSAYVGVTWAP